ncbi:MAG: glutathione S-transferase family protein [Candidatus Binatales bacterium]
MIKLYGTVMSRAGRPAWALEELGLKYEHVPISFQGDTRKPEYLKINPNGHIPSLDDNGLIVWESMAINLYLAEKYGKAPFWPATVEGHAGAYQWSFFGMTELEPHLIAILMNKLFLPAEQRSEAAVKNATTALAAPLKVLDDRLKSQEYLLGKDFTIADLNVASVLTLSTFVGFDLSGTPAVQKWFQKCVSRPSQQKVGSLK